MPDLHRQLRTAVARLSARPLPAAWTANEPDLAPYQQVDDLVAVIGRADRREGSDEAIRALVRLGRHDPDATVVLLGALVPAIGRSIGHVTTAEFRREVLTDLAAVILEIEGINHLDDLARRLTKRAYRRSVRRLRVEVHHRDHHTGLRDADLVPTPADVEKQAVDRVQLAELAHHLRGSVDAGRISARTWAAFCDGKLLPALTGHRLPVDRRATYGAARVIQGQLEHAP